MLSGGGLDHPQREFPHARQYLRQHGIDGVEQAPVAEIHFSRIRRIVVRSLGKSGERTRCGKSRVESFK